MTAATAPRLLSEPSCVWPAAAELGEGTCWSTREAALYWLDILSYRLCRWTPATGARRQWQLPDTISAVAERAAAPGLAITLRRGFATFDPDTGVVRMLHEPEPDRPNNRFNAVQLAAEPLAGELFAAEVDSPGLPAHRFAG